MDPQTNASIAFNVEVTKDNPSIRHVLMNDTMPSTSVSTSVVHTVISFPPISNSKIFSVTSMLIRRGV